jgi:hypothetical protein
MNTTVKLSGPVRAGARGDLRRVRHTEPASDLPLERAPAPLVPPGPILTEPFHVLVEVRADDRPGDPAGGGCTIRNAVCADHDREIDHVKLMLLAEIVIRADDAFNVLNIREHLIGGLVPVVCPRLKHVPREEAPRWYVLRLKRVGNDRQSP